MKPINTNIDHAIEALRSQEAKVLGSGTPRPEDVKALGEAAWKLGFDLREQHGLRAASEEISRIARVLPEDLAGALIAAFGGSAELKKSDACALETAKRQLDIMGNMIASIERKGLKVSVALHGGAKPDQYLSELMDGLRDKFGARAHVTVSFTDGAEAGSFSGSAKLKSLTAGQRGQLLVALDEQEAGVKDVRLAGGTVEVSVGNQFDAASCERGAQIVQKALGDVPVRFVRNTQGELPKLELHKGIAVMVQSDGSRVVHLTGEQQQALAEKLKGLGVTRVEHCYYGVLTLRVSAPTSLAQAKKAIAEAQKHVPADLLCVWHEDGVVADFGKPSSDKTFEVDRNKLKRILDELRYKDPSINTPRTWMWRDPNLSYDRKEDLEKLHAQWRREEETGILTTTGLILRVDPAFDPAGAKALADTVRSRMGLPGIPVQLQRVIDGSDVNAGKGADAALVRIPARVA